MKTIQELYDEILASQELKEKFVEAANAGKQEAFLKEHGCEATLEEVAAFLKAKSEEDAPLSLDELENSAGGACNRNIKTEVFASITVIGCVVVAIDSAASKGKHLGRRNENEGRICNYGS